MAAAYLLFYVLIIGLFIWAYWKIWSKAGFNGAWALLMLIPVVNVAAFFYLAFADWPVHRGGADPEDFR